MSAFYQYPAWSPAGDRIVAYAARRSARVNEGFGPGYELVWLPRRVARSPDLAGEPRRPATPPPATPHGSTSTTRAGPRVDAL
ncbi:MAG: hypothetical protein U0133_06520 [Gemmatimonadales bacterium]